MYQGGALRAQVEIRTAEQKQAVAEYARAGQRAFGEVENALAAESALRDRESDPRRPRSATASARSSSRSIQYRVGSPSTCARSSRASSRCTRRASALLRVQTERLAQRVNLYLALGGGFDLPAMEPVAAQ